MSNSQAASITRTIITNDTQDFQIRNWQAALFVVTGDVDAEILGVPLGNKETLRIGGNGYALKDSISIVFDNKSTGSNKEIVCIYEVFPNSDEQENCDV